MPVQRNTTITGRTGYVSIGRSAAAAGSMAQASIAATVNDLNARMTHAPHAQPTPEALRLNGGTVVSMVAPVKTACAAATRESRRGAVQSLAIHGKTLDFSLVTGLPQGE